MDEELKEEQTEEKVRIESVKSAAPTVSYTDTMEALKQAESTLPEFSSSYDDEIKELYGKIINRREFSYSPNDDPVYGSYRDRYIRDGRLAMRDTMGKAAALTGGYASSYGQAVGQQQYEAYLQKLNDVLPELYEDAYGRYKDEGNALMKQYEMTVDAAKDEYDRHRDNVSDAKYGLEMTNKLNQQSYERVQEAYSRLYQMISKTGYEASDEELEAAGMSREQAEALRYEFMRVNKLLPVAGGGDGSNIGNEFLPYNTAKKSGSDKESTAIKSSVGLDRARKF